MTRREFIDSVVPLHDDMHRLAGAITGSAEDASDAVQDTMLRLWNARERIPPDTPGRRAYCLRALRNHCLSLLERRRESEQLTPEAAEFSEKADSGMILSDSQRLIGRIIEAMPENQRTVLRLMTTENLDTREAARLTGFSEANVRQLLSRARKHIRDQLTLLDK